MSTPAPRPMTVDDFYRLPDDGQRWELLDGGFVVTPSPTLWHQKLSRRLQHALMAQLEDTGLAEVINAPADVVFDRNNVFEPDLVIVSTARASLLSKRAVEGAPDVVVEILSPSTAERDRRIKFSLYERFGVREYWIIDPEGCTLEAYRLGSAGYELRARLDRTGTLSCPEFPTLQVPLAPVFA